MENLCKKYKPLITPGYKSIDEFLEWIQETYDIEPMPISEFSEAYRHSFNFNAFHSLRNEELGLKANELEFICYRLLNTSKNSKYYNCFNPQTLDKSIHIVLEVKTGYILSNSSKVFLELCIGRGVTQYDYDNNTLKLRVYLGCLDHYAKKEY